MAIRRDSLRAERDFYSPMTGNTGTKIRYAAAPTQTQSKYGSQVKDKLSDIGQGARRSAPLIKAIKVAVKKTDDPFTQIKEQKSYAPQEENAIGSQIEGIADAAQDAVSEGVAQAETAVEEYRKGSSQKAAERRAQRQQERQSDLKARKAAADERAALRGDMKKLFARDKRMYGNTVPKGSFGSGSKPGPAVDTRPRHSPGGPGDQPKVSKFEKPKGGQGGLNLGATTLRQGEKPTGPAVKVTNYKDIRKARLDRREKARQAKKEGTTKAVNASTFKQKNVRGSGIPGKSGKVESARPKQVANLPSNYKATEAKAFAEAKAHKERQAEAKRKAEAEGRAENARAARAAAAKAKAQKVKSERARAQAAAAKAKSEGKTKAQQAAAARKAAGPNRTMSAGQQTRAQAGPSARTAAGNRARVKANARKRAQAAAKKRKAAKKKSAPKKRAPRKTRTRTARRRGRRRGRRRCDIRCKVNISLLMNMNLLRDDLADVAYFVRELREVEL